ncbi:hypothetical protein AB0H92_29410 [Streptomyces phaeochromogenes]|uniref:hypothetical protein n=1 Tax=Streptomyces phaeochromogenes TaxID=1923 RepID=UPI00340AA369
MPPLVGTPAHEPEPAAVLLPGLDTVQLDAEHGSVFLHADFQLENYRTFMSHFEAVALKEAASRDLIREIINAL